MTRPTVPIISLANFDERTAEISQQLSAAAEDVGFFYIKDHGLPEKLIDDIFQAGHSFRGLTTEQKKKFTWYVPPQPLWLELLPPTQRLT